MDPISKVKIGLGMAFYFLVLPLLAVSGPAYYLVKVAPVLEQFNTRCNTRYNIIDVAIHSGNLTCQPKVAPR